MNASSLDFTFTRASNDFGVSQNQYCCHRQAGAKEMVKFRPLQARH
jgi:hypothetical protein